MKAVHFGAGKIGRGFIGLLLRQSGYDVTFVDVDRDVVGRLAATGQYPVRFLDTEPRTEWVRGVTALLLPDQHDAVAAAVAAATIVTTSVGPRALPHVAPVIAAGLSERNGEPLAVIACENLASASARLGEAVAAAIAASAAGSGVAEKAVYPNAVVDRIVPETYAFTETAPDGTDPLAVAVEPYAEWLVDAAVLPASIPPVAGMDLVTNVEAYVERKLFMLNMGHAVVAFLGALGGFAHIHEAVASPPIRATLAAALFESGLVLRHRHGFAEHELAAHAARIMERFGNPLIRDRVERVARDPLRKLAAGERLVAPAQMALDLGILPRGLARGIAAGLLFAERTDDGVAATSAEAIAQICGVSPDSPLALIVREELAWLCAPGGFAEHRLA